MKIKVIINPDGLEWKRAKWNWFVKQYFKISELTMLYSSDLIICDSKGIESYIKEKYKNLKVPMNYIAYGAYPVKNKSFTESALKLLSKYNILENEYYLVVGRFIPENNYELILNEFIKSNTSKKLLIISNVETNKFYSHLIKATQFNKDPRIIFAGSFYDSEGLESIRYNAFAYIHGHSAGGTNPSLVEALSTTSLNLLYDVVFNREVALDSALYFDGNTKSLSTLINNVELLKDKEIEVFSIKAKKRISEFYTWNSIADKHKIAFDQVTNAIKKLNEIK